MNELRLTGAVAVAGLLLSACGSGSGYGSAPAPAPAGGSSPTGETSPPTGSDNGSGAEQIATATGPHGTYLTADEGKAVYLWQGDSGSTSNCSNACSSAWPPVLTSGAPKAGSGAVAADLGTTKRGDGTMQVTYKGHPLYYFAGDSGAGQTNGEGSNGFGATWWLVSPAGAGITGSGTASTSSAGGGSW